jgi:tRNA (guanine10-N2)-dimethyltransferase
METNNLYTNKSKNNLMKQIFVLSKQDINLAEAEVLALAGGKPLLVGNLLILDTKFDDYDRLAYSRAAYQFLFRCNKDKLYDEMKKFNWQKIYKKDFCLRFSGKKEGYDEAEFASQIWRHVKNPKVNLDKPHTIIYIFLTKKEAICGKLITEIYHEFEERRAHLRPELSPVSLHPKLARCLVNLSGIKKGVVIDPFVGTGGILIEAGFMGFEGIGYDIDAIVLKKCESNLKYFHIPRFSLVKQDSTLLNRKMDYVVTDLPYGRSSRMTKDTYAKFLGVLKKHLGKQAVLVFPDFVNYKKLIKAAKLKLKEDFSYYIHKSLTRKIAVITK